MTITYHNDLTQGSDEWLAARCGLLTASEMKLVLTPTLKIAKNDKTRAHVFELAAQRITQYVEPTFIGDDMLRGMADEIKARDLYARNYDDVTEVGFVTNDKWGFTIGCSPDALVGDDGMLEIKSRRQKYQIETILAGTCPDDYLLQVQTALLVTERKWLDFISYSGGLPMVTMCVWPDDAVQAAILEAAADFEAQVSRALASWHDRIMSDMRLIPTEREIEQEMYV